MVCKCGCNIPELRVKKGYKTCVSCSTESKWSGVQIVHHKTGNETQIIKDPEVAADFIAKSARSGYGTLKGVTGSQRKQKNTTSSKKVEPVVSKPVDRIISRKKVETNYKDEEVASYIFSLIDKKEYDLAKIYIEDKFQSLLLSPNGRKQLLFLIN
jgi:hypothetical protein